MYLCDMIKNIVFDFGGVLVNWNRHFLYDDYFGNRDKTQWFLDHVVTIDWGQQMDAGRTTEECISELKAKFPEWTDEIEFYRSRRSEFCKGEIPGMYELMMKLKANGYHLWGLSNWYDDGLNPIIQKYPRLFKLLEGTIVSAHVLLVKPDIRIYQCFFNRFHLNPSECLFIDDKPENIEGSRKAGMDGIIFESAEQLKQELMYKLPNLDRKL